MDRRKTLKALLVSSVAGGALVGGCKTEEIVQSGISTGNFGQTPEERERDAELHSEEYFLSPELETLATLCDIILPATDSVGGALDANVPEFIEFIAKDMPNNQIPIRGGIMWLDSEANQRFGTTFNECEDQQQLQIIDDIAYPDPKPEMEYGAQFFDRIRNLTLTGYYTTKMGIDELGYVGNRPNVWDGVPEHVLKKHNMSYDPEWMPKFVDQSKRDVQAEWDDDMNLIS